MCFFDRFKRKNNDEKLESLKKENEELKRELELKEQTIKIQDSQLEFVVSKYLKNNGFVKETEKMLEKECSEPILKKKNVRGKDKTKRKSYKRGRHISEYAKFEQYAIPRAYDKEHDFFYVPTARGAPLNRHMSLGWNELVEVIKGVHKKHAPSKMIENPILKKFTVGRVAQWSYIYRAGGFNGAIKKYASEMGYDANMLLSTEVV